MPDLQVIYDPDREMAALVDMETMRAAGPVGVGRDSPDQLMLFANNMPDVVLEMGSYELTRAYAEWWLATFRPDTEELAAAVEPPPGSADYDGHANPDLAEHEATETRGEPPPVGPADADVEADESAPPTVIVCPNCNGDKIIRHGDDRPDEACTMCAGKGVVQWATTT